MFQIVSKFLFSDLINQDCHTIESNSLNRVVWVGRDLKAHLIPTPCHGQGHLPLDQVAQLYHSTNTLSPLTQTVGEPHSIPYSVKRNMKSCLWLKWFEAAENRIKAAEVGRHLSRPSRPIPFSRRASYSWLPRTTSNQGL